MLYEVITNIVGCISKSMINQASEELIEGGKYLQAFDNTFKPENVKHRNQYNFELILNALVSFKNRITSYNVCYTKLLRIGTAIR